MSGLVNRDIIKVMSMTNSLDSALDSAASTLDVCSSGSDPLQLCLRPSVTLAQSSVGSACRRGKVCVQSSAAPGLQKKVLEFSGL
jgi:hypothetical protein